MVDFGIVCLLAASAGPESVTRAIGAATCTALLQPLPISHHFHGCTVLLVLRFVVVKWRYIKHLALPFYLYFVCITVCLCLECPCLTFVTCVTALLLPGLDSNIIWSCGCRDNGRQKKLMSLRNAPKPRLVFNVLSRVDSKPCYINGILLCVLWSV